MRRVKPQIATLQSLLHWKELWHGSDESDVRETFTRRPDAAVWEWSMEFTGEPQIIDEEFEDSNSRIQLLVIVIWFGGFFDLLFSHAPDDSWSWIGLRWFIALACMFLLGCPAFLSVTEVVFARSIDRASLRTTIALLIVGAAAAISVDSGSAAFLMLLLSGFALDWWGTPRK